MSRRRQKCEHPDGAWEIALADLMTVLMIFFLVMWLTAIIEPEQRDSFVESVIGEGAAEISVIDMKPLNLQIELEDAKVEKKPEITITEIETALKNMIPKEIYIEQTEQGIKITLHSDSFFESGRANIKDKTRQQLEKLATSLVDRNQTIIISGYTDNMPIANFQFPSNWELSAARAANVARFFVNMGLEQKLITIQGMASNNPVAKNDTSHGRSLNRRVIILVKKGIS